MRKGRS